ncbi:IS66 family insertion sequence element accessory protein TnpA [Lederbergia ruris]|uniref:IS66 family insertion sequence element accessory protein TnpA n=1 Tax=Lederbergia ruris TaxID=217495 RepID=UPI00399F9127
MAKVERRKMWEERIAAFRESGQTQTSWCEENEINIHQLRYWLRKFRTEVLFESSSPYWVLVNFDKM